MASTVTVQFGALGGSPSAPGEPSFNTGVFVYHVDLILVFLLAAVVLVCVPRAIALLCTTEWYNGFFLRSSGSKLRRPIAPAMLTEVGKMKAPKAREIRLASDLSRGKRESSDKLSSDGCSTVMCLPVIEKHPFPQKLKYPPHIPTCPPFLRSFQRLGRLRVFPGYSFAQLSLVLVYAGIIAFAAFYRSNIFVDSTRTGWVALSQYAFIYLLGAKNNVIGALIGRGYEKLNFFHRFAGRILVILVNLHGIHYIYKWTMTGTFMHFALKTHNLWGLVSLACVDMIFFYSLAFWRKAAYNIFLCTHILGFTLLLPATYMHHSTNTQPYILAAAGSLVLDRLMCFIRSRFCTATLLPLPELRATLVCIPTLASGWRAGQHVRLRLLSLGMGWFGWVETHPFTVVSLSGGKEGLMLIASRTGGWTERLAGIADSRRRDVGPTSEVHVRVVVEGPYGGPGNTIFTSFSSALFVVGGSGITFALSVIPDLIRKDYEGRSRLKAIDLHWAVQDPMSLISLLPALTALLQSVPNSSDSISTTGQHIARLTISVYYTRPPATDLPHISVRNLTLIPGRPQISSALDTTLTQAVLPGPGAKRTLGASGVLVAVCGPVGMGDGVVRAVRGISAKRREKVGGVEIHEEVFGW